MKSFRTCIACRQKRNKGEFFRIVSDNGIALYDKMQRINSRGIYLCRDRNCLEKCIKLIDKNKISIKISVDKISLKDIIKVVENELGE